MGYNLNAQFLVDSKLAELTDGAFPGSIITMNAKGNVMDTVANLKIGNVELIKSKIEAVRKSLAHNNYFRTLEEIYNDHKRRGMGELLFSFAIVGGHQLTVMFWQACECIFC